MNPSGAATYTFSNGSSTVSPTANGSYSVTGTSLQGCVSATVAVASVSVIALPVVIVNSGSICAGQVFTFNPTGATSYSYSNGSSTVSPSPGIVTYSVTGADLSGCASQAAVSTVTSYALPVVTVNSGSICAGQTFMLSPVGAVSYTFSNGSATVSPSSNSSYTVSGTSQEGCVSLDAISTVTVKNLPNIVISSSFPSICVGETTTLTASGALSYTWSGGETTDSITITPSATFQYTVSGHDSNGCMNSSAFTQTVDLCLGLDHQKTYGLKLYPNPSGGELNIDTETAMEIDLINSLGELKCHLTLVEGKNQLDLQDLANGMYFIILKTDQSPSLLKVIKQ
jgi:hypothetical protein